MLKDTGQVGGLGKSGIIKTIFDEYGLGEEIALFYEKEIIKSEADFLFVIPRKCLTEYKALVGEGVIESVFSIQKACGVRNHEIRYGTPKSFILYVEEIKRMLDNGDSFVISVIDDIIMHGRGISLFLDRFLNCFSEADAIKVREKIKVVAFVRNAEIPFLQEKYPDIYESIKTYRTFNEPSDLKRISDLFINSFAMTMTPNTSFVNSWIIKADEGKDSLYHWLKEKTEREKGTIYQEYVSYLNEYKISIFNCKEVEYFRDIVEFACVRCYTSNLSRITLIPYVFLKSLKGEEIDKVYCELLGSSCAILVKEFWNKISGLKNEDAYMLKLEYLIRVISEIYGCQFLKEFRASRGEIRWSDYIEEDVDALRFSYINTYYDINELFCAFENYQHGDENIVLHEDDIEKHIVDDEESMRLFENSLFYKQKSDERSFIDDYFSFNSDYDDRQALNGKERLKGITTEGLKKELKKQNSVDERTFYGHLLCCMDSGKAALTISCVDDIYISVLKSGEQAYRLLTEENQWVIKYLSKIEESFINLCLQDLIVKYMDKYIKMLCEEKCIDEEDSAILRYLSREVEKNRKNYFNVLISDNCDAKHHPRRTYMRDYYVKRVEETPEPEYEEKLRKVYDSVMAYS